MGTGAYTTFGPEFLVNTNVSGVQTDPTLTALASGGFVICWTGASGDGSGSGVRAQMYDANGLAVGAEFQVNTSTLNNQDQASVASLTGGGFVVTWTDNSGTGADADRSGVKAQMYDAFGQRVGGEFLANTTTKFGQSTSVVTGLAGGGYVISWVDASATAPDAKGTGVRAQIYSSTGTKIGGEFLVNTTILNSQQFPVLTSLASGGFVASWIDGSGIGGDPNATGIKAQIFSAFGAKVGTEFLVNTAVVSSQDQPVITSLTEGGFVIVWRDQSGQGDTSSSGLKAQIYDVSGAKIGGELVVNSTTFNSQDQPSVTSMAGGGFAVSWRDNSILAVDSSGFGIKTQVFDAFGNKLGGEFQVNGITLGTQEMPSIVQLASGALVVSWTDYSGQNGDADGSIKARILVPPVAGISDLAVSNTTLSETAVENTTVASLTPTGALNAVYTYEIVDDSTGGAFAIHGSKLVVKDSLALDYEASPSVTLTVRTTDTFGNVFDKVLNLTLTDSLSESRYAGGEDVLANTTIVSNQQQSTITALSDGKFVLVWSDGSSVGTDASSYGIKGQIVSADGVRIGSEFLINTQTLNNQDNPTVSALPSGDFVVSWVDNSLLGGDASASSIKAQIYDANGIASGGEFLVNSSTANAQRTPAVASLSSGGFVITWTDSSLQGGDASSTGIKGQLFDTNGNRVGNEFLVNTITANAQDTPVVASLTSGGFVISWHDTSLQGGDSSKDSVKAQLFDASGAKLGGEFLVNTQTAGNQQQQTIIGLASGGFVISWADASLRGGDTDYYGIKLQVYDNSGNRVGGEVLANTTTTAGQLAPTVAALSGGGFMVSWTDYSGAGPETGTSGIKAQIFADDGSRVGAEFIVETQSQGAQVDPAVAGSSDGGFAVLWTDFSGQDGDDSGTSIKFKKFSPQASQGGPPSLVATADTLSSTEDQSATFLAATLLANDVDSDGLPFSLTSVASVSGGTVALQSNGDVAFAPIYNFSGAALFTYLVTNSAGVTATGRVTVNVAAVNDAPIAYADQISVSEDGSSFAVSGLLANDVDVDPGDSLTLLPLPAPTAAGATLTLTAGSIAYAAGSRFQYLRAGETASDNFSYSIVDQAGATASATVSLIIVGANDAPLNLALSVGLVNENAANGTVVGTLAATDVDANEALSYSLTNSAGGRFVVDGVTGIVTVANGALLDYESATSQVVIARATDLSGLFTESSFTIGVNNLPEPKFYTGDNGINTFTAPTNDLWTIKGLGGNDVLTGNISADTIYGDAGNDTLDGGLGADTMYGGIGNDIFYVDNTADTVIEGYGEGADQIIASVDFMMSANVEKLTQTGTANIGVTGNDYANTVVGNLGNNVMYGGVGGDLLQGMEGADTLYGQDGNDYLQGGAGDDVLVGGVGLDELTGGAGADRFIFDTLTTSVDRDTVKDFTVGEDLFILSRSVFDAFASTPLGTLPSSSFINGAAANTTAQRIIYNGSNGGLYYDADGSGAGAMVQIAYLGNKPVLTASSFGLG
jgi:VCBS repeat-containing protein